MLIKFYISPSLSFQSFARENEKGFFACATDAPEGFNSSLRSPSREWWCFLCVEEISAPVGRNKRQTLYYIFCTDVYFSFRWEFPSWMKWNFRKVFLLLDFLSFSWRLISSPLRSLDSKLSVVCRLTGNEIFRNWRRQPTPSHSTLFESFFVRI